MENITSNAGLIRAMEKNPHWLIHNENPDRIVWSAPNKSPRRVRRFNRKTSYGAELDIIEDGKPTGKTSRFETRGQKVSREGNRIVLTDEAGWRMVLEPINEAAAGLPNPALAASPQIA